MVHCRARTVVQHFRYVWPLLPNRQHQPDVRPCTMGGQKLATVPAFRKAPSGEWHITHLQTGNCRMITEWTDCGGWLAPAGSRGGGLGVAPEAGVAQDLFDGGGLGAGVEDGDEFHFPAAFGAWSGLCRRCV